MRVCIPLTQSSAVNREEVQGKRLQPPAKRVPLAQVQPQLLQLLASLEKKEQEQSICVPLPLHLCAHALQGTQPPQTQAEGQADKLHQNNNITSKQPEILSPPG